MVGKSVTLSVKWPKKATEGSLFMSVNSSKKFSGFVQWFIRLQQLKEMQSSKVGMTERGEYSSKPLVHSIVERILVLNGRYRHIFIP